MFTYVEYGYIMRLYLGYIQAFGLIKYITLIKQCECVCWVIVFIKINKKLVFTDLY